MPAGTKSFTTPALSSNSSERLQTTSAFDLSVGAAHLIDNAALQTVALEFQARVRPIGPAPTISASQVEFFVAVVIYIGVNAGVWNVSW